MDSILSRLRRTRLALAGFVAIVAAAGVFAFAAVSASQAAVMPAHDHVARLPTQTAKAVRFHDRMRALWEEHGAWTRMVIVSFVGNLPNLPAAERVLLANQVKIGNAVKPYYGRAAGDQLTKLLKQHILGAVNVLVAAKSGDPAKVRQAEAAWSANGRQVAGFLHSADPRFLSRAAARQMMKVHLAQVIGQATDELTGDYAASARAYAPYIHHILDMADMISGGIVRQFPARFR
jgi:hypothetical protein